MLDRRIYEALTAEDDGRICRDIPESACRHQPRNFLIHVLSLAATKTGDGLADPKIVLSWLLGAVGAPAAAIGLLVPVREAGALLPQLFTAAAIRSLPQRKWVWAAGSVVQGLSVLAIAAAALALSGAAAGWTVVAFLFVFALGRSACSVAYKDVLGKTVSKSTRGTATGTASAIGAATVLLFGALLSFGIVERSVAAISGALILAGLLWIAAALVFVTVAEEAGATEGGGNPLRVAIEQAALLREDSQLVRFIAARGLLISTALAPPYLLAQGGAAAADDLGALGSFVLASAAASALSTYVWGRLSDRSSRRVLMLSGLIAALALGAAALVGFAAPRAMANGFVLPALLFVIMISYQGVRIGRSTHLVDMASAERRGAYTALSNTIVGVLLTAGGIFGFVADIAGMPAVLAVFSAMAAVAAVTAQGLREVQS